MPTPALSSLHYGEVTTLKDFIARVRNVPTFEDLNHEKVVNQRLQASLVMKFGIELDCKLIEPWTPETGEQWANSRMLKCGQLIAHLEEEIKTEESHKSMYAEFNRSLYASLRDSK